MLCSKTRIVKLKIGNAVAALKKFSVFSCTDANTVAKCQMPLSCFEER